MLVLGMGLGCALAQGPGAGPAPAGLPREARGAMFLTRIRLADPDYRLILMACLKENELNLLLSRHVSPEEIPVLTKGLLIQLSQQLPGENLTVIAFRPVVPLKEAGVARLNIGTGRITYTGGTD
jgi:hypothetical protein